MIFTRSSMQYVENRYVIAFLTSIVTYKYQKKGKLKERDCDIII